MYNLKKLISKNFGKFFFLLSLDSKEGIIVILLLLISVYICKSPLINNFINKINNNVNNHENNQENESNELNESKINKKNIKTSCKKKNKKDPYENNVDDIQNNYDNKNNDNNFLINVNNSTCSTPIFNMRKYEGIDFYFNFLIHDYDPKKINNLIMCKDIHKWMSSSSLTNDDLNDNLLPIYFIKKTNNLSDVYEYLKIFIHTDNDNVKIAFVQKGSDYYVIQEDIEKLIEKGIIKDLLSDSNYYSYNLSLHDGVVSFLERFLSLVLIPEDYVGEQVELDIQYYHENTKTFDYYFNIINSDTNMFNTSF